MTEPLAFRKENQNILDGRPEEIWLVAKGSDPESLELFLKAYGQIRIRQRSGYLAIASESEEKTLDIAHIREKCLEEVFQDFSAFVKPRTLVIPETIIVPVLMKLSPGIYYFEQFIEKVSLSQLQPAKQWLKHYFENLCGVDVLSSVLGFIHFDHNASQAAKALFMHRNTLNYRLDLFIRKSGLDIRHFYGSYVLYLLFHS
ncbi:MAG: helix-turn-helix domain-containing protein [Candidatus Izemoplasmatales bacterium]|jgi:hypothetical protein|nr:helix-turn-helix domain-containing protein [Candidatus Izemoplasmatales bacterium]MDD4988090.1 helix-turn-helix domain-containing protein [Candidatus Izemoplasmatales bacterium]MDD5602205.1 helix-turn-helix domain-containing protein [Candidatus Izemoplasmatales bacterium]MDY0373347.1 helix-turn-helix domain-containing protein [Candidatus Izemoplasmatales bacterium]NLF48957.1 hypothetical protein [Acholeplasmataceae bacterium]